MSVQSCVGLTTSGALTLYEVRTVTKGRAADNKPYVSSKTAGRTFREAGNLDASWEITLYAKSGETEVPAALKPGQTISVQLSTDGASKDMIIDSASLEVDIEAGELANIALSCSAVSAVSY